MAEVTGIPPTDPSKGSSVSSVDALTGVTALIPILDESRELQSQTLEVVQGLNNSVTEIHNHLLSVNNPIKENTLALLSLQDIIKNASVDIKLDGKQSDFFTKLVDIAGNDKKMTGLETFSKLYERVVIRMYNLEKYATGIEKTSSALFGAFSTFKEFGKGLAFFAGGLALLGFTLVTFIEAITLDEILTFGAIMLVLRGAAELVGKGSWDLAKVSIGIATLGLAVWGFTELIDAKTSWEFLKSITLVSAGVGILGLLSKSLGPGSGGALLKGAAGIVAIAGSVWLLNKAVSDFDDVDLEKVGKMALVTGALGLIWYGLGTVSTMIFQGSLAAAAIGGSLWLMAKGINDMSSIDISLERGLELTAIIVGAAGIFALIGNPITLGFTLAGAAGAAAIGGALWILSKGLNAVNKTNVTSDQAKTFGFSLERTVDALAHLGNPFNSAPLLLAVPAAIAVAGSTLALFGAMNLISKMKIMDESHYNNFGFGINSIVDIYASMGLWDLGKATIAAGIVTLISGATVLAAGAITLFTKLSSNPESVQMAVLSLDNFVTGVSDSFEKNTDKFKHIRKGVGSFLGMSSMVKEIADSVQSIANLEFYEKEIRDGKVVITGVRKFNASDFEGVGISIGSILNAITDPLAKISSQKDSFSIGGFQITNPFSNKVKSGIESMMGIGAVFTPLTEIVKVFSSSGINSAYISNFNKDLAKLLNGVGLAFSQDGIDIDEDVIEMLGSATTSLNSILKEARHSKFDKSVMNFSTFAKDLTLVKKSMNDIDISKISKFNSMLANINELKKTDAISELVDVFSEFIEKLTLLEDKRSGSTNYVETQVFTPREATPRKEQSNVVPQTSPEEFKQFMLDANDDIVDALQKLYDLLSSGSVRVQTKTSTF